MRRSHSVLAAVLVVLTACARTPAPPPTPSAAAAVPDLIELLASRDPAARAAAASGLAARGGSATSAVPALARALYDPEAEVRRRAAVALFAVAPRDHDAVRALEVALRDDDGVVRLRAAEALVRIGPAAQASLDAALVDGDARVREAAAYAVSVVPWEEREPPLAVVPFLFEKEHVFPPPSGEPQAAERVVALADAVHDPDPRARFDSALALVEAGYATRASARVLVASLADDDEGRRASAARALRIVGRTALVPLAIAARDRSNAALAQAAAQAILLIGGTDHWPGILDTPLDPVLYVPGIGRWTTLTFAWILETGSPARRQLAAESLAAGAYRDRRSRVALERALGDADPLVRASAAKGLGRMQIDAVPSLASVVRAVADPDARVRANAAEALGRLGPLAAIAPAFFREPVKLRRRFAVGDERVPLEHAVIRLLDYRGGQAEEIDLGTVANGLVEIDLAADLLEPGEDGVAAESYVLIIELPEGRGWYQSPRLHAGTVLREVEAGLDALGTETIADGGESLIVLPPPSKRSVTLEYEDGRPLAGATVVVSTYTTPDWRFSQVDPRQGRFGFCHLLAGRPLGGAQRTDDAGRIEFFAPPVPLSLERQTFEAAGLGPAGRAYSIKWHTEIGPQSEIAVRRPWSLPEREVELRLRAQSGPRPGEGIVVTTRSDECPYWSSGRAFTDPRGVARLRVGPGAVQGIDVVTTPTWYGDYPAPIILSDEDLLRLFLEGSLTRGPAY